jgi:hypothetical protein
MMEDLVSCSWWCSDAGLSSALSSETSSAHKGNKLDPAELTAVGVPAVQHRRASGRNLTTYVRVTLRYC